METRLRRDTSAIGRSYAPETAPHSHLIISKVEMLFFLGAVRPQSCRSPTGKLSMTVFLSFGGYLILTASIYSLDDTGTGNRVSLGHAS